MSIVKTVLSERFAANLRHCASKSNRFSCKVWSC